MNAPIVIIGCTGTLGQDLLLQFAPEQAIGLDRDQLDITQPNQMAATLDAIGPAVVINAAAYNAVDDIESDKGFALAMQVNAAGPENLARYCAANKLTFVHYSTDYVFSGSQTIPYTEADMPQPAISRYAKSKRAGEERVLAVYPQAYVARLSRLFGKAGSADVSKPSFVDVMLQLATTKTVLDVVDAEVASPTYTVDVAAQTRVLLEGGYAGGIYHLTNSGGCTWYEFATEIFAQAGCAVTVRPVGPEAYPRPAKRPPYSVLANTKLPPMRSWQAALVDYLKNK